MPATITVLHLMLIMMNCPGELSSAIRISSVTLRPNEKAIMATILYLTDLYYKAQGRNYYEEDLYITSRLKDHFNLLIGHPQQALHFLDTADIVVFRNTGPVMWYKDYFNRFMKEVKERGTLTYNSFDGRADMKGKQYLPDLTAAGYPVIPTVVRVEDLEQLGATDRYIVKLKDGADSIGMSVLSREELLQACPTDRLIQPFLDFQYEVSFYYQMSLPEESPYRDVGMDFTGQEGDVTLLFSWFQIEEIERIRLLPTFLRNALGALPDSPVHVIHVDQPDQPGV